MILNLLYFAIIAFVIRVFIMAIRKHSSKLSDITILFLYFHLLIALSFCATYPVQTAPIEAWSLSIKINTVAITFIPLVWIAFIRVYTGKEMKMPFFYPIIVAAIVIATKFLFRGYTEFYVSLMMQSSITDFESFVAGIMFNDIFNLLAIGAILVIQTISLVTYLTYVKENKTKPKFEFLGITISIYIMILLQIFGPLQVNNKFDANMFVIGFSAFLVYRILVEDETKHTISVSNGMILDMFPTAVLVLNSQNEILYANQMAFHDIPNLFLGEKFQNLTCIVKNDEYEEILDAEQMTIDNQVTNTQHTYVVKKEVYDENHIILELIDATVDRAKILKLKKQSMADGLTGLLNKTTFTNLAKNEITEKLRNKDALALAMFDLDHFKKVNDTYGHAVGDDVLVSFASDLNYQIREDRIIGRFGGEEFCAVISAQNEDDIKMALESLRDKFEHRQFVAENVKFNVTVSIGVVFVTKKVASIEDLIGCADKALYESKNTGRNKITYYNQ